MIYASLWQVRRHPWLDYFQPPVGPGSGICKSTDGGTTWAPGRDSTACPRPRSAASRSRSRRALGRAGSAPRSTPPAPTGPLPLRRRRGDLGAASTRDASLADSYMNRPDAGPARSGHRLGDGPVAAPLERRRQDVQRRQGRAGRRRLPLPVDRRRRIRARMIARRRPGRGRDAQRRRLPGAAGTTSRPGSSTAWPPTIAFPYWIYSGQQDSGTVAIASAAATTASSPSATGIRWAATSATATFPIRAIRDIVYGAGLGGRLSRWDARTGAGPERLAVWPVSSYGQRPTTARYRYDWITPLAISRRPPACDLPRRAAALPLARRRPDLAGDQPRPDRAPSPDAKDCDGDVPVERATACGYGVIFAIAPSPAADGSDLGRHRQRPCDADPRRRRDLAERHAARARATGAR